MFNNDSLLQALKKVMDPELGLSIVDLGMVKLAEAAGDKARIRVDVTVDGCPLKDQIRKEVEAAAKSAGALTVELELGVMRKEELDALKARLGASKSAQINPSAPRMSDSGGINRLPKKVPNLIAVSSGKGGVGKSSVTSQLALALSREGFKVGILDADITGPSIARIFGCKERPMLEGPDTLLPVPTRSGVDILSMNLMISDEKSPVIWRGPLINGAIRQLYSNAKWEGHDFLLVDMPPGTSDATLTVFQSLPLDGAIIVTSPQALVEMVVAKSIGMAKMLRIPILGLIENLAYVELPGSKEPFYLFGRLRAEEEAARQGVPYLGAIPIRPELAEACDRGEIDSLDPPQFRSIAKAIIARRMAVKS